MIKKIINVLVATRFLRFWVSVISKAKKQWVRVIYYSRYRYYFPKGGDSFLHGHTEIKYPENITIGDNVIIGPGCTLGAKSEITIGDFVRISKDVLIETAGLDLDGELPYSHVAKPIIIGKGVWLGARSIVLGGVTIGDNAVVGAGAIISADVPSDTVVVGHGRIINKRVLS